MPGDSYQSGTEHVMTVHFEGCNSTFNQRVSWNDDKCLAPLYSFTKLLKCLVELLSNKKKSDLWPCRVQFRMPHPLGKDEKDKALCLNAQHFL